MKKAEIIFSSILLPIDYILIILSGLSAYYVRYSEIYAAHIREVVFSLPVGDYLGYLSIIALVWIVIFALSGLYSMKPNRKMLNTFNRVFLSCSTGTLIVIVAFFFSRELFSSRFIILAGWVFSVVYIVLAHWAMNWIQRLLYLKGVGVHRIILVGGDNTSHMLAGEFNRNPKLGYRIVERVEEFNENLVEEIKRIVSQDGVDEIVQSDPNLTREETLILMDIANEYHLDFKYTADLLGAKRTNIDIKAINGIPLVEIKKTPLDGWGKVAKRLFDIVGSIFFLILFSPFYLITPILIKIDSRGPIFYSDERVGARGKKFYLHKFRSMVKDADKMKEELMADNERMDGPLFKMENDPRITKIGKFIRKTSIDELPNFWNVLLGNMSLVGPRPHEPHEVARYEKHHKKLLDIKPGITGMAQVSGRSGLAFEDEVKLDVLYIETWSLWLDIIILLKTPLVLIRLID